MHMMGSLEDFLRKVEGGYAARRSPEAIVEEEHRRRVSEQNAAIAKEFRDLIEKHKLDGCVVSFFRKSVAPDGTSGSMTKSVVVGDIAQVYYLAGTLADDIKHEARKG